MVIALEGRLDLPDLDKWVETLELQTAGHYMRTAAAEGDLAQHSGPTGPKSHHLSSGEFPERAISTHGPPLQV